MEHPDCKLKLGEIAGRLTVVETRLEERTNVSDKKFQQNDEEHSKYQATIEKIVLHTAALPTLIENIKHLDTKFGVHLQQDATRQSEMTGNTVRLKMIITFVSSVTLMLLIYGLKSWLGG